MNIFKNIENYLYVGVAGALLTYTAHNPPLHDLSIWLLGVIGHAIGATTIPTAPAAPKVFPYGGSSGSS